MRGVSVLIDVRCFEFGSFCNEVFYYEDLDQSVVSSSTYICSDPI